MRHKLLAIGCALTIAAGHILPAFSEPVEMRLRGGDLVIKGDLASVRGNAGLITSPDFGAIMLEIDRFDCQGPGCIVLGQPETSAALPRQIPGATFGIRGSNTVGEALSPALIEAYAKNNGYLAEKRVGASAEEIEMELFDQNRKRLVLIDAQSHGSGTSATNLLSGAAEIGASSRLIKDTELKALNDAGLTVNEHVLALDGMPVIVSPSNPVEQLTLEQIAKIFAGEIADWSEVGGTPGAITIYARDDKSGTSDTFASLVLDPFDLELASNANRYASSVELSDNVTRDPNGIGFIGFAYIRNAKPLTIGTNCGIASNPTEFAVKTEEYALARRLYYYTTNRLRSEHAKGLLDFALSDTAQPIIAETGFINQDIEVLPFSEQGDRLTTALSVSPDDFDASLMQDLVVTLTDAQRLSVTFRFEKNSGNLEQKSLQDIQRLTRYLQRKEQRGKQILLLGFTDASGTFATNRTISLARADAVRAALSGLGNIFDASRLVLKAYSELMPVDCNDTEKGRTKNRRVEVWLKE